VHFPFTRVPVAGQAKVAFGAAGWVVQPVWQRTTCDLSFVTAVMTAVIVRNATSVWVWSRCVTHKTYNACKAYKAYNHTHKIDICQPAMPLGPFKLTQLQWTRPLLLIVVRGSASQAPQLVSNCHVSTSGLL